MYDVGFDQDLHYIVIAGARKRDYRRLQNGIESLVNRLNTRPIN